MEIKINNKTYTLEYKSKIGAMYFFEVLFGREFDVNANRYEMFRLFYSILYADYKAKGEQLDVTFEEFVCSSDEWIEKVSAFVEEKSKLEPKEKQEEKGEGEKN